MWFRKRRRYPWYDSWWLNDYVEARAILERARPRRVADFEEALRPLRTDAAFRVVRLPRVFDADTLDRVRETVRSLRSHELNPMETRDFGRSIAHDHPTFLALQKEIEERVGDAAGEPVETAYNFLSLYGPGGICRPHLDAPTSKWTLDLCVDRNVAWPIHVSQVIPWPEDDRAVDLGRNWAERIIHNPSLTFEPCVMDPGEAVLFSGSSQWHYRDRIPPAPDAFCHLLFFHFIPRGTSALAQPVNWSRLFDAPELDVISAKYR